MADYLPKFKPGEAITRAITGTVTGGRIVTAAGIHAAAAATDWLGVASRDAVTGERITVYTDGVQRVVASGAIAIGSPVICGAAGTVVASATPPAGQQVGVALEAAADTAELDVKFSR